MNIIKVDNFGKQLIIGALAVSSALLSAGCAKGTNPIATLVNNVQLKTYLTGTDQWVEATASLTTGGFMLAGVNLPITDPYDHTKVYGQINLAPNICGVGCNGGDLTLSLNITASTNIAGGSATLPNGTPLPIGGLQTATIIDLPIGTTGARLYFAFGKGVAILGTAMTFSALDPAGQYVPGVDVFQPLTFGTIVVDAGIFAGAAPNTTGVGLFIDLSTVVNQASALAAMTSDGQIQSEMSSFSDSLPNTFQSTVTMETIHPSANAEQALYTKMYSLSQRGAVLEIK